MCIRDRPILVRKLADGPNAGKYEIIAGERRFRASKLAGLDSVPVLVRDVSDQAAAAMAQKKAEPQAEVPAPVVAQPVESVAQLVEEGPAPIITAPVESIEEVPVEMAAPAVEEAAIEFEGEPEIVAEARLEEGTRSGVEGLTL